MHYFMLKYTLLIKKAIVEKSFKIEQKDHFHHINSVFVNLSVSISFSIK